MREWIFQCLRPRNLCCSLLPGVMHAAGDTSTKMTLYKSRCCNCKCKHKCISRNNIKIPRLGNKCMERIAPNLSGKFMVNSSLKEHRVFSENYQLLKPFGWCDINHLWLVVSAHLKNISQNGNLPQIGVKIKNLWNHHLDLHPSQVSWNMSWALVKQQGSAFLRAPLPSDVSLTEFSSGKYSEVCSDSFDSIYTINICMYDDYTVYI